MQGFPLSVRAGIYLRLLNAIARTPITQFPSHVRRGSNWIRRQ
ncbi:MULTISPECIES: hypothetical protein [unclassified Microcoleus]